MVLVEAKVEKETVSETDSGLILAMSVADAIKNNSYTEGIVLGMDENLHPAFKVGDVVGFDYNTHKAVGVRDNYLVPYINIRYIK